MNSHDAMQWAFRQAEFLTPSANHLLLYLTGNAFYSDDNQEGMPRGVVLSARSSQLSMVRFTGMSERTIRRALEELELRGYIKANMLRGPRTNTIIVLWGAKHGEERANQRTKMKPAAKPIKPEKVDVTANVVSLSEWKSSGHSGRNYRS